MQVNDMFYAHSTIAEIQDNGECGGVATTIMSYLLENNIVDAVLGVKEGFDLYDAVPCLITDYKEVIEMAGSLHFGALNLAKFISKYLNGCRDIRIAVSCKPCDAMTIRELIKKGNIIEDNIIMIGLNCGGTMLPVPAIEMIKEIYELDPKNIISEEIANGKLILTSKEGFKKAISIDELEKMGMGRRENCRRCSLKIPRNADLALGNWGVIDSGKETFVEVLTKKGAQLLEETVLKGLIEVHEAPDKAIQTRQKINNFMLNKSMEKKEVDYAGTTGDIIDAVHKYDEELSKCIKCYGCREACPLCFCTDCCLEAEGPEWVSGGYTPAAPLFHLTRMVHMVDACTNCGQCSDVCPCEIPISKIWSTVNNKGNSAL